MIGIIIVIARGRNITAAADNDNNVAVIILAVIIDGPWAPRRCPLRRGRRGMKPPPPLTESVAEMGGEG